MLKCMRYVFSHCCHCCLVLLAPCGSILGSVPVCCRASLASFYHAVFLPCSFIWSCTCRCKKVRQLFYFYSKYYYFLISILCCSIVPSNVLTNRGFFHSICIIIIQSNSASTTQVSASLSSTHPENVCPSICQHEASFEPGVIS